MVADTSVVMKPGPWEHRRVAANGARFNVALAGKPGDPLVVLLHGFPSCWYEWRGVIPLLAEGGCHVAAMDLRGFGASDKTHRQINTPKFTFDVAGVISSLGYEGATIVGRGAGAHVAWAMPSYAPEVTDRIVAVGTPHPHAYRKTLLTSRLNPYIQAGKLPGVLERSLVSGEGVRTFLSTWAHNQEAVLEAAELYTEALKLPFAARSAVEILRWQASSPFRSDMRIYLKKIDQEIEVPALAVRGAEDLMYDARAWEMSAQWAPGLEQAVIADAGHFVPEEAPAALAERVLALLGLSG
ncbi:MAG: alpha/beta hydrolase [bacterium]|nr:alpha/beta hydrolase [bacterium]